MRIESTSPRAAAGLRPLASAFADPMGTRPGADALLGSDAVTVSLRPHDGLKRLLEPAFNLVAAAGYPEVAQRLRRTPFILTDGQDFGVEYHAVAYPMVNAIGISRDSLRTLSTAEMATVLVHEGTHLEQGILEKGMAGRLASSGRLRYDFTEAEAYRRQWQALRRLGITDGEMYWTVREALHEMGLDPEGVASGG